MTGGSTDSSTSSGASSNVGRPGISASPTPVSTSRMDGGTLSRAGDEPHGSDHDQQRYRDLNGLDHRSLSPRPALAGNPNATARLSPAKSG